MLLYLTSAGNTSSRPPGRHTTGPRWCCQRSLWQPCSGHRCTSSWTILPDLPPTWELVSPYWLVLFRRLKKLLGICTCCSNSRDQIFQWHCHHLVKLDRRSHCGPNYCSRTKKWMDSRGKLDHIWLHVHKSQYVPVAPYQLEGKKGKLSLHCLSHKTIEIVIVKLVSSWI